MNATVSQQRESIGKSKAAQYFSKNIKNNRNVSKVTVTKYSKDMLNGNWQYTGEAIKFDRNDNLIDGQHRLQAIIESGLTDPTITVDILVVRGLEPEVVHVLDTGKARTFAHALKIRGIENYSAISPVINHVYRYEQDTVYTTNPMSVSVGEKWLDDNLDIINFVNSYGSKVKRINGSAALVAALWLIKSVDPTELDKFVEELISGPAANTPTKALENTLRKISGSRDRESSVAVLATTIHCWNEWRKGGVVRKNNYAVTPKEHMKWRKEFPRPV